MLLRPHRSLLAALLLASAACGDGPVDPLPPVTWSWTTPALSPDGTRLALAREWVALNSGPANGEPSLGLYLADSNGEGRTLLRGHAEAVSWHPDGRTLLYHTAPGLSIVRRDLASGAETVLSPQRWLARYPAWSPDGARIAFDTDEDIFPTRIGIHLMSPDGSSIRRVTPFADTTGEERSASWSPAGRRLAYAVAVTGRSWSIAVIDTTGTGLRLLTAGDKPAWSPMGEWIAFVRDDPRDPNAYQVAIVRPDGSGMRALSDAVPGTRPAWRRDGRELLFVRRDRIGVALYAIDLAGGAPRRLAAAAE